MIYDYSSTGLVIKAAQSKPSDMSNGPESNMTADEHRLLNQYKEVIREQDQQLTLIRREICSLKEEHSRVVLQFQEQSAHIQQLKDQNALLKAQKSATIASSATNELASDQSPDARYEALEQQINNLLLQIEQRDSEILVLVKH